jgi:hypothetical protein
MPFSVSDNVTGSAGKPLHAPVDFVTRIWFAWACYFRVLFDGAFAARVWSVANASPALPEASADPDAEASKPQPVAPPEAPEPVDEGALRGEGALLLLGLMQRDGRLVDFLQQDIASFDDADVGAAARVIHDGCRKIVRSRFGLEPIRSESEGKPLELDAGFDVHAVKLTGNVSGSDKAVKGTLKHKGWRATKADLPEPTKGHDGRIVCQAEVEV